MNIKGLYEFKDENGNLDYILYLNKKIAKIILRIKKQVISNKPKEISLNEILLINLNNITIEKEEQFFLTNSIKNYKISIRLEQHGEFRDSLLHLHLSIELFFKHCLAKSKYAYYSMHGEDIPLKATKAFQIHDVNNIMAELKRLSPEIRNMTEINKLSIEVGKMKSQLGEWQNIRYYNPNLATQQIAKGLATSLRLEYRCIWKKFTSYGVIKWT